MKRQPIEVNGIAFKTKKSLREYTQKNLAQKTGEYAPPNVPFLMSLFKRHPEADRKLSKEIKRIKIFTQPNGHGVYLFYADGTMDDISWNICVTQNSRHHDRLNKRKLIADHVRAFRLSQEQICTLCGATDKELHVDHTPSFKHLVELFESEEDQSEGNWIVFHNQKATLQILCCDCNALKGDK